MQSILAAATAPYVSTKAGVLMPVKAIVTPEYSVSDRLNAILSANSPVMQRVRSMAEERFGWINIKTYPPVVLWLDPKTGEYVDGGRTPLYLFTAPSPAAQVLR